MDTRIEKDSLGQIAVPSQHLWGAQTARSLEFFNIGCDLMPKSIIKAYGMIKQAAAEANGELGALPKDIASLIQQAAQAVIDGHLDDEFPLKVWQTGSGTQTNMNVNEVLSNYAIKKAGGVLGSKIPVHPNDHVNLCQSSNDTFPTAMHIAATEAIVHDVLPALEGLHQQLIDKQDQFANILKIGRTHLMDATSLTLGQEFSAYAFQVQEDIKRITLCLPSLYELAIGATAVGTGLNALPGFAEKVVQKISNITKLPFVSAPNKFSSLSNHDALVFASGALKTVACSLMKMANDIRLMGSGPRAGLNELLLPENEPGSSIMPGKINPTQCEALTMVSVQVIGNDAAITLAASQGHFELNVFKPLIIYNFLHSCKLLSDGCRSFTKHLLVDLKANCEKIREYVEKSLMQITALTPVLGYDVCAKIALKAHHEGKTLRDVCVNDGYLSQEEFNQYFS